MNSVSFFTQHGTETLYEFSLCINKIIGTPILKLVMAKFLKVYPKQKGLSQRGTSRNLNWEPGTLRFSVNVLKKSRRQSGFLEAPLVRQADSELKKGIDDSK